MVSDNFSMYLLKYARLTLNLHCEPINNVDHFCIVNILIYYKELIFKGVDTFFMCVTFTIFMFLIFLLI